MNSRALYNFFALTFSILTAQTAIAGSWDIVQTQDGLSSLQSWLYVPTAQRPIQGLILALHGCHQSPYEFAEGTRLTELAEREAVALLVPEQSKDNNSELCWNWFNPLNQIRDRGLPFLMIQATRQVLAQLSIQKAPIYALGLSAGGVMTNILAVTYPEVFEAVAIHSGLQYGFLITPYDAWTKKLHCSSISGSTAGDLAYSRLSKTAAQLPHVMILHGDQDPWIEPCNGDSIFEQWMSIADHSDDGIKNRSIPTPSLQYSPQSEPGKYPILERIVATPQAQIIHQISIQGLGHAWSGGRPNQFACDPNGPSATEIIWNFFKKPQ